MRPCLKDASIMNLNNLQNTFWDKVAESKEFHDPFYIDQLEPLINNDSLIIEYGCGYGRLLNLLSEHGYKNTSGFDFSSLMIAKGKSRWPKLDLHHIQHAALPLKDNSVDAAILSTVLCCIPDQTAEEQIIQEIHRVLKIGAPLYLTDFLITDTDNLTNKYQKGYAAYNEWGVYQTSEGALVRHFNPVQIEKLLSVFSVHWYQEGDFVTMNHNSVKTFHGIYIK